MAFIRVLWTYCISFALFSLYIDSVGAFNEAPASQEAAIGSEAIFRCQHPAAFSLGWRVNGTFYIQGSIPDITLGFNTEDGNLVSTLTIVATVDYNGTRVACVASLTNGSTEISAPVLLIVQDSTVTIPTTSIPATTTSTPATTTSMPATTTSIPTTTSPGTFIEFPRSQRVVVEEIATFRCRHSKTNNISWMINETLRVSTDNPRPDIGIVPGTIIMMESGDIVHTLSITGRDDYDNTSVVGIADLPDGSKENSHPVAILQIFDHFPTSLNVSNGSEAVFRCGHPNAAAIGWTVDGSIVNNHPDFRQKNTTSLTITAHPQYNSTMVQCIVFFIDRPNEVSPPADLLIQGALDAVGSLTKVGSTLSWVAPFFLDLTNIDPDIVYCVDVYNITCGGRDLVSSDCHVTDTNYIAFSDGYLYEYIVTPRSNVEGAGNGTQSHWRDELPLFSTSSTQLSFATSDSLRNYQIELTYSPDLPIPSSYTLSLEALDGLDSFSDVETTATIKKQPNLLLQLGVPGLESRRLWNCTIFTFECQANSIVRGDILSTHDFQVISVSPSFAGTIRISGIYTEGSPATGVFVIVSGDSDSYYHIATRDGSDIQEATITGIAGGEYSVSVFVVEENGLPFERAATVPSPLSVEENNGERPSPSIDYSLESTSSGVCVKCTFLDTDASECVVVVYSDLMNIESSRKFTRSGDTASGCIEGVNLEDYQVGVVGGRLLKSGPTQALPNNSAVIIGALIPTVFTLFVIVIVLVLILKIYLHKRGSYYGDEEKTTQLNHYSSVPAPHVYNPPIDLLIPSVHVQPIGGIYDTVIDIASTPNSTHSSSSSFGGASQPLASTTITSEGESNEVNENTSHYATLDVKPQPVSVPPTNDSLVVYAEVNKTRGAKEQLYAMLDLKKGITESNPDDLTQVIYSDIHPMASDCDIQRPPPAQQTNLLTIPPPDPFTAKSVFSALLPVASKWQVIGEAFPLSEKRLDDIGTTEGDEECLRQMIEAYMLRSDLSHTWDEIVNVLKKIGEDSHADKIFKEHVAPCVITFPNQPQLGENYTLQHGSLLPKTCVDDGSLDTSLGSVQTENIDVQVKQSVAAEHDPASLDNMISECGNHSHMASVCQGDENPETSMQIQSDSPHQTNVGVVEMPCCNGDQFNSCSNRNAPTRRIDTDGDSGVSEGDENSRTSEVKNSISEEVSSPTTESDDDLQNYRSEQAENISNCQKSQCDSISTSVKRNRSPTLQNDVSSEDSTVVSHNNLMETDSADLVMLLPPRAVEGSGTIVQEQEPHESYFLALIRQLRRGRDSCKDIGLMTQEEVDPLAKELSNEPAKLETAASDFEYMCDVSYPQSEVKQSSCLEPVASDVPTKRDVMSEEYYNHQHKQQLIEDVGEFTNMKQNKWCQYQMWRLIRKVLSTTDFKKRKRTLSFQMFALVSYFPVSVYKVMVQPSSHVDIQNCVVADDVWFMTTRPSVHSSSVTSTRGASDINWKWNPPNSVDFALPEYSFDDKPSDSKVNGIFMRYAVATLVSVDEEDEPTKPSIEYPIYELGSTVANMDEMILLAAVCILAATITAMTTRHNGRVRYLRKRISALMPECVHMFLNYTESDDIFKCSTNKRIKVNAPVEQDVSASSSLAHHDILHRHEQGSPLNLQGKPPTFENLIFKQKTDTTVTVALEN